MGYEINYADVNLHEFVKILNVERTILPQRSNYTVNIPAVHGEKYTGFKYGARAINIECLSKALTQEEHINNMDKLAYILNTKQPEKMIISDSKDRYCYAVLEGDTSLDKFVHNASFTLTFICYDPYYYAVERDYFEPSARNVFTINNEGTADAYPLINCVFKRDCNFFQATNYEGRTVLIGSPDSIDSGVSSYNSVAFVDPCETMDNWSPAGQNSVDGDRKVVADAKMQINAGGYAIMCSNFGTDDTGWHGGALRANIGKELSDFRCRFKISFNSTGSVKQNGSGTALPSVSVKLKVTRDGGCALRKGRASTYDKILTLPKGASVTCTEIVKNWAKTTYNKKTGYVYMGNLSPTSVTNGTNESAETQRGRLEIYGFDKQGNKLFKCVMRDSSAYYEYNDPEIFLGEKCILQDGKATPSPKTLTYKDAEGKTVTKRYNSGKYGDWNEFKGWFEVERTTDKRGKQTWNCKIQKLDDSDNIVRTMKSKTIISGGNYPTGNLSNIIVYMGQWKDTDIVQTMILRHVHIRDLSKVSATKKEYLFNAGDELQIDFLKQKVYLNGCLFMSELDIGSEFFSCPHGESEFKCLTDDNNAEIEASILKRWI